LPTPIPIEPDAELRNAVLLRYELSHDRRLSLYDAWFAARTVALEMRPDMEAMEAGRRVALILAWNDLQHEAVVSTPSRPDRIVVLCA
jgi:hypothetical protein